MKAMEILSESTRLDERPASMLGQIAKRAGAGVLGAMGLNTLAGSINDKADVGMFANRYYKEFMNYLKSRNRSPEQASFGDLKSFMSKNKIPTHNVPNNPAGTASKEMVNSILNQTANEYLSGKSVGGNTSAGSKKTQPAGAKSQTATNNNVGGTSAPQAKVDDLIKQIASMNAEQLSKVEQAIQAAKSAAPSTVAKTPAEIRAEKQAKATQAARSQLATSGTTGTTGQTPSPGDIRAQKQAVAAKNAQAQMTTPPVTAKPATTSRRRSRNKKKRVVPAV